MTAIFVTYLALGAGILGSMGPLTRQQWPARAAAVGAVLMGHWMMRDHFLPVVRRLLHAPPRVAAFARSAAQRGTPGALLAGGFPIGLCTVRCSGAVCLGVLSLLSLEASRMKGFAYLVLYNLIFVVPLLMILSASAARPSLHTLNRWQMAHRESVRMLLGSGVVVMGLLILATL